MKTTWLNTRLLAALLAAPTLSACAVVTVVDAAASVAVRTVELGADAAIGTVRVVGRAAGAAADAVIPSK